MTIKFTATKLAGTGKQGILRPDADGYYEMVVGGLNILNSAGEYYLLAGARWLFDKSSIFQRRVANGCLKAETGHPKMENGMTYKQYVSRIFSIEETNVCAHFKEIWLDESYGSKNPALGNPTMTAIMAKVKPTGPKGAGLESALNNPHENVCFSIRAVTKDHYERGQCYRVLDNIVTFDWVTEPGISIATKWSSPALESMVNEVLVEDVVRSIVNDRKGFAMEDSAAFAAQVLGTFERARKTAKRPGFEVW